MKILVVSAHFPPNFVSGGTLAPQRLARGLRARGHDVSVYAGHLDAARTPLETWTDSDETGLPVRWIVTTPWTGWSDERNFDNPSVVADFSEHVATVRPEVVHVHSVQTLGGGVVAAAKAAGATVVVTMHDFWWFCARQFLVTRDYVACSLVVDCGVCPCEVDRQWLEERNRNLAAQLRGADLVLAPSASAADVFAANGVPEEKLRVDENGLPEADRVIPPRPRLAGDGPVRFRYTGGWNRMKGAHVIVDAARALRGVDGWTLTAHDIDPYLVEAGVDVDDLPVTREPSFGPNETDAVFAGTDVLVVPSIMRESHSIVTREALTRGVPVVCTDTLGPEEVVEHDVNGLIVPAGDTDALARAMRSLIADRPRLHRLTANTGGVPIRSLADQVLGLEATYRELLDSRTTTARTGVNVTSHSTKDEHQIGGGTAGPLDRVRKVERVLFIVGITGAPLRYRARLPAEALDLLWVHTDVRHYRDLDVESLAAQADALVVYRVPATVQVLDLIARVRTRGVPVVFDVDDLIFDPDLAPEIPALTILPPAEADLWLEGVRRYRTTMEACDAFVGSTNALLRHARALTGLPTHRFANGVGVVVGRLSDEALKGPRRPGAVRMAYLSGTDTHDHDWAHVEPAVEAVMADNHDVELWLVGLIEPSEALARFGARVRRVPFTPWTELPGLLRDVDVNLAPLAPGSRFNEAKSAIKWLEAALVATPTVASPTEPFREAIDPGVNGYLASTTDEWVAAVGGLLADDTERARIGNRARRDALLRLSPHRQGRRYLEILETVRVRDAGTSSWIPVVHDEPSVNSPLDDYDTAVDAIGSRHIPAPMRLLYRRARSTAGLVRRTWQREGAAAVATKATRLLVRKGRSAIRRGG